MKWFSRFVGLSCKMVLCLMVDCSNKSGKVKGVSFHRVPAVVTTKGEFMEELTRERRRRWISAISREGLSESILENDIKFEQVPGIYYDFNKSKTKCSTSGSGIPI